MNQQWKVLNYEKAKDLDDPISSKGRAERNSHSVVDSGQRTSHHVRTVLHHHCGYAILHILSQLRPNNLHRANQEVVMRVTTVWKWIILHIWEEDRSIWLIHLKTSCHSNTARPSFYLHGTQQNKTNGYKSTMLLFFTFFLLSWQMLLNGPNFCFWKKRWGKKCNYCDRIWFERIIDCLMVRIFVLLSDKRTRVSDAIWQQQFVVIQSLKICSSLFIIKILFISKKNVFCWMFEFK